MRFVWSNVECTVRIEDGVAIFAGAHGRDNFSFSAGEWRHIHRDDFEVARQPSASFFSNTLPLPMRLYLRTPA